MKINRNLSGRQKSFVDDIIKICENHDAEMHVIDNEIVCILNAKTICAEYKKCDNHIGLSFIPEEHINFGKSIYNPKNLS